VVATRWRAAYTKCSGSIGACVDASKRCGRRGKQRQHRGDGFCPRGNTGRVRRLGKCQHTGGSTATVSAAAPAANAAAPLFLTAAEVVARSAWRSETEAWRELAPQWGIALPDTAAEPCAVAQRAQWQCFRTALANLPLVRQLDRPGFITLRDGSGRPASALLLGLSPRAATLRIGRDTIDVTLVSLADLWAGDFATYWRAPDSYSGILKLGARGPAVDGLAAQLASVRGDAAPSAPVLYDNVMAVRVAAFQTTQGLAADGRAGPTTFMQLARATGSARLEPRLLR
jgi:general secretion pathway protein A